MKGVHILVAVLCVTYPYALGKERREVIINGVPVGSTKGGCQTVGNTKSCSFTTFYQSAVKPPACNAVVDLIFVLDSSGSIQPNNYEKVLQFTTDLTSNFKIGVRNVQVGCVVFSHLAKKWFDLKDNPTYDALKLALKNTPYLGYTTYTDEALDLISDAGMFTPAAGARSKSKRLVIVITDGQSKNPPKTKEAAERLKSQGVETIAVGVGDAEKYELINIASSSQNVFKIDNFDALKKIESAVTQRACQSNSGQFRVTVSQSSSSISSSNVHAS